MQVNVPEFSFNVALGRTDRAIVESHKTLTGMRARVKKMPENGALTFVSCEADVTGNRVMRSIPDLGHFISCGSASSLKLAMVVSAARLVRNERVAVGAECHPCPVLHQDERYDAIEYNRRTCERPKSTSARRKRGATPPYFLFWNFRR